ncbi:hypothetical protein GHN92_05125 [Pseudomonas sp. FSL R10-2964]|uniref:hypothetical protein n=1 Tax=Pseudomonas sp. FSL R10-2964 TaxID=2662202 RepID=UPI001296D24E|nr:hypothetical protein [Pseudomonas sp. FSL R10-2964]MQT83950.1 hypothetical protein [Pseudomonas sp. FSL R10-2964]
MHAIQVFSNLLIDQIANLEGVVNREVRVAFRAMSSHLNLDGVLDQLLVAEAGGAANSFNAARFNLPGAAFFSVFRVVVSGLAYIAQPNIVDLRLAAPLRFVMELMHFVAGAAFIGPFRHIKYLPLISNAASSKWHQ